MSLRKIPDWCPTPLVLQSKFPTAGGSVSGRFCTPLETPFGITDPCCIPCPMQKWLYPDSFDKLVDAAAYFNIFSVVACLFILLSFWVLPTTSTHRHYLSVCLVFAVLVMECSFLIGLGTRGTEHLCLNEITPYDMNTSVTCALSGTFVILGGWGVVIWVFLRALSLHLQICWQVTPGRHYFYTSQVIGWAVPAGMTAVALSLTGVSQRFGHTCHINTKNGLASFWGPLLAVAAAAIVIQFVTFGYCIHVYLRSLFEDSPTTETSTIPYTNSRISASYTQAFRRVKRVASLQWRGILVVVIVITDVIIFATVFLQFEGTTEKTPSNIAGGKAWITCLILAQGDKNKCLEEAKALVVPEATAITVLFLLSCNGLWCCLLLGRWSMITAWYKLIRNWVKPQQPSDDFVSFNVARPASLGMNPRTYEDLHSSATFRSDDAQFRDDYKGFEMSAPTPPMSNILVHDSFRPKKNRRSISAGALGGWKKSSGRPPVVREEGDVEFGYSANITSEGRRPTFQRSNTSPAGDFGITRSHSRSQRNQTVSPELEALELSNASRVRQNGRGYPSTTRV